MEDKKPDVKANKDDVNNIRKFIKFFKIPVEDSLNIALKKFEDDQSYDNEQQLRIEVAKMLIFSNSAILKDPIWDIPKKTICKKIVYEYHFDKDVENLFTFDSQILEKEE
jgi:hypothetical protein